MADYKAIKGHTIKNRTSDPLVAGVAGGTWSSGGNLNQARESMGGAGTTTAGLVFGGGEDPPAHALSEEYDGTSWTEGNNLNTARWLLAGTGTQTAGLAVAGRLESGSPNKEIKTEEYDGTNWAESGDLNTRRDQLGAAGTQTAAIAFGGTDGSSDQDVNEEYNGSSWSEEADLNTARTGLGGGFGSSTAAILAGGGLASAPYYSASVESWNGSAWTEIAELNTQRFYSSHSGTSTEGYVFGGQPGTKSVTEYWNGSAWTEVADLSTARSKMGASPQSSPHTMFATGGYTTTNVAVTEEWSAPATFRQFNIGDIYYNADPSSGVLKYVGYGTGAFASGGNLPTVKSAHGYAGTQTAGVAFAGATNTTTKVATSYEYNGSAWSNAENVNTTRDLCAGAGIQTAAILFGGTLPPGGHSTATEIYDGTDWSTSPGTLNTARSRIGPLGTSTATLAVAGTPPATSSVESWNGSAWTEITEINTARMNGGAAGIQTSGLFFGGESSTLHNNTESWNGSSWTEVSELNTARQSSGHGAGSTNTLAIAIGGEVGPPFTANAETWNGSSWTEVANLAQARGYHACGGTSVSAIATGGRNPPSTFLANTEEWTVPEALKTLASTNA